MKVHKATAATTYNYLHGNDARSNASGFLKNFGFKQNLLARWQLQSGGSKAKCNTNWLEFKDGIASNGDILIPQFDEVNPISPVGANTASLTNNQVSINNQANSIYDHYAFVGGKRRKTKRKRKTRCRRAGNDKERENAIKRITRAVRARKARHLARRIAEEDMDSPRSNKGFRQEDPNDYDSDDPLFETMLIRKGLGGKKSKKKHLKSRKRKSRKRKSRKRKSRR
jgi:hypothetical protein